MAIADGERRVERIRAAAEVFVYGYPLVYSLRETAGFAEGDSSLPVSVRMYQPKPEVLSGDYTLPAITRLD